MTAIAPGAPGPCRERRCPGNGEWEGGRGRGARGRMDSTFVVNANTSAVTILLPTMSEDTGASVSQLQWAVTGTCSSARP